MTKSTPKKILMEDGKEIEIDDTPYYIKDKVLYVYVPYPYGCGYMAMGKVKEEPNV